MRYWSSRTYVALAIAKSKFWIYWPFSTNVTCYITVERCIWITTFIFSLQDDKLRSALPRGMAFHHAGLGEDDRILIENLFRKRHIKLLLCTSTLAMGVNLPAHLVIIKSTEVTKPSIRHNCKLIHVSIPSSSLGLSQWENRRNWTKFTAADDWSCRTSAIWWFWKSNNSNKWWKNGSYFISFIWLFDICVYIFRSIIGWFTKWFQFKFIN